MQWTVWKKKELKSRKRPGYKDMVFDGGIFFLFSSWMLAQEGPPKFDIRFSGVMFASLSCVYGCGGDRSLNLRVDFIG